MRIAQDESQHKFAKKNRRVRLRKDKADVYTKAYAGSEAVIKELGIDIGDFPMVYIEWDKAHWLYNGESDMWTFESHFDPVEQGITMPEKEEKGAGDILKQLAALLAPVIAEQTKEKVAEKEPEEEADDLSTPSIDIIPIIPVDEAHDFSLELTNNTDDYMEALGEAFDSASEAEAFLVIAIKPANNPFKPGQSVLMPESFTAYHSEAAGYTLHLAISEIATATHGEAVAKILHDKFKGETSE